ncbi:DUF5663 domain-containing protein [Patescibacteria group bacterium]|nr:DUF5663 domain-containing protein [Patescibacteria group bacterium]
MNEEKNPTEAFADSLIQQANITLPEEELEVYRNKLMQQIEKRLGLISLDALDDKGLEDYEKLLGENPDPNDPQVRDFFSSRIENYEEKIKEALDNFKAEFLSALNK